MPQRRDSSGHHDDFSLEHRLVTQLSAAIRQEEPDHHQHADTATTVGSGSLDHASNQFHAGQAAANLNATDVSGLLDTLGSVFEGSGYSDSSGRTQQLPELLKNSKSTPDISQLAGRFNNPASSTSDNADALSQLTSTGLGSILATLSGDPSSSHASSSYPSSLGLPETASVNHTANSLHPAIGSLESSLAALLGNVNASSRHLSIDHLPATDITRTDELLKRGSHDSQVASSSAGASTSSSSSSADNNTSVPSSTLQPPPHQTDSTSSMGLLQTDPEVHTIQSVLQSLLSGDTSHDSGVGATTALESASKPSNDADSTQQGATLTDAGAAAGASSSSSSRQRVDFNSLSNFGLGAEDQSLVETLRNAITSASTLFSDSQSTSAQPSPSLSDPSLSSQTSAATSGSRVRKARQATPKAKSKLRSSTYTSRPSSAGSIGGSTSFHDDFNASDPDTLRAIQQALLSALGPSASSTSLAESLTATDNSSLVDDRPQYQSMAMSTLPPAPGALLKKPDHHLPTSKPSKQASAAAAIAKRSESGVELPPTDLMSKRAQSSSVGADKSPLGITGRLPSKFPLPKPAKPVEVDRQKQREENAARKRKWRELNHIQNRDRDLRARIVKRAHELYGESESPAKSTWIEQEFNRRRHRRILRAGIHSIVESARIRALKAQEIGSVGAGEKSPIGDGSRTLTQQSKQAASSQLSQLFRNSNAALEPQLHNDKLPVPLAPYMLVASPKRPPFKMPSFKSRSESTNNSSGEVLQSKIGDSSDATADVKVSDDKQTEDKAVEGSAAKSDSEAVKADSVKTDSVKVDSVKVDSVKADSDVEEVATKPTDSSKPDPSTSSKDDSSSPATVEKGNTEEANSTRPKHRYAMVGDIKLGVPPNLAAIYMKVRGKTPFGSLRVKSHASTSS